MDENPLNQIEDEKAMIDLGRMGFRVYKGAIEEGASTLQASLVTSAYFRGMFGGSLDSNDDKEKDKDDKET